MLLIFTVLLAFLNALAFAADQSPDVAFSLTQEYRPDTEWRTCRSAGNVRTNCGFCYLRGSFLGWNCACDTFCHNTMNECYYITESNPGGYDKISCVRDQAITV
ncbi:hypothetical protein SMMN14_04639 [Sphaerulina musiva]